MILDILELPWKLGGNLYSTERIGAIGPQERPTELWLSGRKILLPEVMYKYKFIELEGAGLQERLVLTNMPMDEGIVYNCLTAYPISVKPIGVTTPLGSMIHTSMLAFCKQINEFLHTELSSTCRVQSLAALWYDTYKHVNGVQKTHDTNNAKELCELASLGITPLTSDAACVTNWITTEAADPYEVMDSIETSIAVCSDMNQFLTDTGWCPISQDPLSCVAVTRPLYGKDIKASMHPSFGCLRHDLQASVYKQQFALPLLNTIAISMSYWKLSSWIRALVETMVWYPHVNATFVYDTTSKQTAFFARDHELYRTAVGRNINSNRDTSEIICILPMIITELQIVVHKTVVRINVERTIDEELTITLYEASGEPIVLYFDLVVVLLASETILNAVLRKDVTNDNFHT